MEVAGIVLGEEAHIRSSRATGPRNDPAYPVEKLDSYENLLLLCPTHHTLIDKGDAAAFPVDAVVAIKQAHEQWVDDMLGPIGIAQRAVEERLVASVAVWAEKQRLSRWKEITGQLNRSIPRIREEDFDGLMKTSEWLLRRDWPREFPLLNRAFNNLGAVLRDLVFLLRERMTFEPRTSGFPPPPPLVQPRPTDFWVFERHYKQFSVFDRERYDSLLTEDLQQMHLLWGMVIQATKAVNFVISAVRTEIDSLYRFDEGYVLLEIGDEIQGTTLARLEYSEAARFCNQPYPGFKVIEELVVSTGREFVWEIMLAPEDRDTDT